MAKEYTGLLCIGDPHLASNAPGFRKDDYPQAILDKLAWSFNYAKENALLPTILGDLFHWPRDNTNRLLVQVLELFDATVLGITGNHDCRENELAADDTLSVISAAGRLRLIERSGPWTGNIGGRSVVVGGTGWGQSLPLRFDPKDIVFDGEVPLIIWLTHLDIRFPGYDEIGRFEPKEIDGIDIVVNGHIHRPLTDVIIGKTTWINPGNIARVRRNDADRNRRPGVLRINIRRDSWDHKLVEIPFAPFENVFHQEIVSSDVAVDESIFVRGLAELESLKTYSGAGLKAFLDQNLGQFHESVATEIRALAEEVCNAE